MCNLSCGEYQVYQEVRKFSRPVIFDVGYDEYPYSVKSTAFLISYRGHGHVMTAKHVLKNIDPNKILIPFDELICYPQIRQFILFIVLSRGSISIRCKRDFSSVLCWIGRELFQPES